MAKKPSVKKVTARSTREGAPTSAMCPLGIEGIEVELDGGVPSRIEFCRRVYVLRGETVCYPDLTPVDEGAINARLRVLFGEYKVGALVNHGTYVDHTFAVVALPPVHQGSLL